MKKTILKTVLAALSISIALLSCQQKESKVPIFAGEVVEFKKFEKELTLKGSVVPIDGPVFSYFKVIDSLIIFGNMSGSTNSYLYVNSLNSGALLGEFCPNGKGPNENTQLLFSNQWFRKGDDILLSVFDYNKPEYKHLNLTQSVRSGKTVVENVQKLDYKQLGLQVPIDYVFELNNGDQLIKSLCSPTETLYEHYTPNTMLVLDSTATTIKRDIKLFNRPIMRQYNAPTEKMHYNHNDMFFYSLDAIKPSGDKIAMSMQLIGQINIVDIESGKVVGYKLKGSHLLEDFETLQEAVPVTYTAIDCDDQYIFVEYNGNSMHMKGLPYQAQEIHVFDWEGNPKYKLTLDKQILKFRLNPTNKKIYAVTSHEEVLSYDLSDLYSSNK